LSENQSVNCGERYGIIRFGSRLDIYMPKDFSVKVKAGQLAISGETVLAEFKLPGSK
jgi:phosphatidylserine decarboxylase